ncbi:MAG TPA: amidohydrolase, partial [Bacillota bacterium]|nr:amidohydrolase [Bacillota bacterium]
MTTILYHGNIYVQQGQFVEALLIEDNLIQMIGSNEEVLNHAPKGVTRIDLEGRTVLPGFNDSHMHLQMVGRDMQTVNLYGAASIDEVIRRGRAFLSEHPVPAGSILNGSGWNQDYFSDEVRLLNRHDLDQISTEHILIFTRACGHVLTANTLAIQTAGVTAETLQPTSGHFDTEADGTSNGIFRESANSLIYRLQPTENLAAIMHSLNLAMDYAASQGITSVQTMDVNSNNTETMLAAYTETLAERPTLRVYHQCNITTMDALHAFAAKGHLTGKVSGLQTIGPIKLFMDGSLGARTALMRQPYADDPSTSGIQCVDQAELNQLVAEANHLGFQVTAHAIGDGAIELILNAYDVALQNGQNPLRNGVVHCQITDPVQLLRFLANDILAQVQPIFLHYDLHIVRERVGSQLADTSYAFGSMHQMGIHVSFGTDSPVENMNPFHNIYCAVTRRDLNGSAPYNLSEGYTVADAIDAYTIESAYVSFEENKKGRLQPGFLADLV